MDAAAELGRNPVSKHQIQPEYGDKQANAGRDCRTRLARSNSQAPTGTGKYFFPCSNDHEQHWQPYPVDSYPFAICDHTPAPYWPRVYGGTNQIIRSLRILDSNPSAVIAVNLIDYSTGPLVRN